MMPSPAAREKAFKQIITDKLRADCATFIDYIRANGMVDLANGLQALPTNSARYNAQYQSLSLEEKEMVGTCAVVAADELLSEAWSEMTPEEQTAHNKWQRQKLAEATAGRSGVSVYCPPGTPPEVCKDRIHEAVDKAECRGGLQIPMGEVAGQRLTFCVPRWLLWTGGALVALTVVNTFRRGK
jgi:hypothetical protein